MTPPLPAANKAGEGMSEGKAAPDSLWGSHIRFPFVGGKYTIQSGAPQASAKRIRAFQKSGDPHPNLLPQREKEQFSSPS